MSNTAASDDEVFKYFHDVKIDHDNIAHYRGLMAKKLLINRCDDCGNWIYPHRPLCPKCLSWNVIPTPVSGKGRLYMYTLIMQSRDPDMPLTEPIQAAAIELAEQPGLRYLSRVVNCPVEVLAHDMPVALTWIEENGRFWPVFQPTGKAHG
ncbi:Zn-ribbon domain-containing OB-fold protein [Acidocella sp.]|uniref:Zn-ribbon domain-containing OB-fold protein n=1 Tax=Acidocella sp. TaxID=50710 RepID=UPI002631B04A|nr:zinc ribbon domain-containing protein [Acidocella sp.]